MFWMIPRIRWIASTVAFGVLPFAILLAHFSDTILTGTIGWDFRTYYDAAKQLVRDGTPYGEFDEALFSAGREYVYPPLGALVVIPLTALPPGVVGVFATVALAAAILATPLVLGVRDWRCLGVVFLWPPVIAGLQTGNLTIVLGLVAALIWRFRDRHIAGLLVGIAFAVKFLLWPLVVWLAATRRWSTASLAAGSAVLLLLGSWAVVRFDGLREYGGVVRRVSRTFGDHGYTPFASVVQAGISPDVAALVALVVAAALVWGVAVTGRRGMDRRAFTLAIAASLAVTPIVWLEHYAWLIVVVAIAQPRLGPLWLVPLAFWVTAGTHSPTEAERVATLVVAALTVFLSVRVPESAAERRGERSSRAIEVQPT